MWNLANVFVCVSVYVYAMCVHTRARTHTQLSSQHCKYKSLLLVKRGLGIMAGSRGAHP